ncbi:MAG: hypothetical protein K0Q95_1532 [Bacteroidota bacterium]|jgi:hypothetical protein|nr:hypothetical protein [Bacteroidota bacterium]
MVLFYDYVVLLLKTFSKLFRGFFFYSFKELIEI